MNDTQHSSCAHAPAIFCIHMHITFGYDPLKRESTTCSTVGLTNNMRGRKESANADVQM